MWRKIAEQYQSAAEYYRKSAEAYVTSRDRDCWKDGQRFGGNWQELDSGFEFNSGSGRRALQGVFQLEKAVECIEKAILFEKQKNQPLSDLWRKAAEQYQITAEYSSKHAAALASSVHFTGDEKASFLMCIAHATWKVAQQLENAATSLGKSIEAEKQENQPLSDLWRKTAEQNQAAVEHGLQHAETLIHKLTEEHRSENKQANNARFYKSRDSAISSAEHLNEASLAFEKFCQAERNGNMTLSNLWRKSSEQNQIAAEFHRKDVEAYQGQGALNERKVVYSAKSHADQLKSAATSLEQAIEAENNNNQPVCILWKKSSEQWQIAAESMRQSSEAYSQHKQREGDIFDHASRSAWRSADQLKSAATSLEKAIKIEKKGNQSLATLYRQASDLNQLAAEYNIKDKKTYTQEDEQVDYNKRTCFYYAAQSAEHSEVQLNQAAESLKKVFKCGENENQLIAMFRKAVDLNQVAAEYSRKALQAYVQKNKTEGERFDQEAKVAKDSAHKAQQEAYLIFLINS